MSNKLIKNFHTTGPCEIYVDKVVKTWNSSFSISQWNDEYRLVKNRGKRVYLKFTISQEQALGLIQKLSLAPVQSILRSGKTWKRKEEILADKEIVKKRFEENRNEFESLSDTLYHLNNALNFKS